MTSVTDKPEREEFLYEMRRHICQALGFDFVFIDLITGNDIVNLTAFSSEDDDREARTFVSSLVDENEQPLTVANAAISQKMKQSPNAWVGKAVLSRAAKVAADEDEDTDDDEEAEKKVTGFPYAIVPIVQSSFAAGTIKGLIRVLSFDSSRQITSQDLSTLKLMGEHLCTKMPQFARPDEKQPNEQQKQIFDLEHVLIVHANRLVRRRYSRVLTGSYNVIETDHQEKTYQLLKDSRVDLIILDSEVKGTSGTSLCKELKSSAQYKHVPIILVTNDTNPSARVEGLNAGADDCLSESCFDSELQARVKSSLRHRKTERELAIQLQLLEDYAQRLEQATEHLSQDKQEQLKNNRELEMLRWESEILRSQDRLLHRISNTIRESFNISENLQAMLEDVSGWFSLGNCFIILPSETEPEDTVRVEYFTDDDYEISGKEIDTRTLEVFQKHMQAEQALIVNDAVHDRRLEPFRKDAWPDFHFFSMFIVPVTYEQKLLGLLGGYKCESQANWNRDNEGFFKSVADQVATGVMNARLYARVQRQATTDGLTGLYNHRTGQEKLAEQLRLAERYQRTLAVIMLDVDHFKSINDNYGHPAGDSVLKSVARLVKGDCRDVDLPVRYGGEEFLLVLPEISQEGAAIVAERIRKSLTQETIHHEDIQISVSASFGIAAYPEDAQSQQQLLDLADKALYLSKRLGRNQVHTAGDLMFEELNAAKEEELKLAQEATRTPTYADIVGSVSPAAEQKEELVPEVVEMVKALATALYSKSSYNKQHHLETARLAELLAKVMGLSQQQVEQIRVAGLLHDVGTLNVPAELLNKPGKFSADEREIINQHPVLGAQLLRPIRALRDICEILENHHERWDGKGFPRGLKGEEIPLAARIVSIVDSYHAMISDRPYRPAMTREEAIATLRNGAAVQWDPFLVDIFVAVLASLNENKTQSPSGTRAVPTMGPAGAGHDHDHETLAGQSPSGVRPIPRTGAKAADQEITQPTRTLSLEEERTQSIYVSPQESLRRNEADLAADEAKQAASQDKSAWSFSPGETEGDTSSDATTSGGKVDKVAQGIISYARKKDSPWGQDPPESDENKTEESEGAVAAPGDGAAGIVASSPSAPVAASVSKPINPWGMRPAPAQEEITLTPETLQVVPELQAKDEDVTSAPKVVPEEVPAPVAKTEPEPAAPPPAPVASASPFARFGNSINRLANAQIASGETPAAQTSKLQALPEGATRESLQTDSQNRSALAVPEPISETGPGRAESQSEISIDNEPDEPRPWPPVDADHQPAKPEAQHDAAVAHAKSEQDPESAVEPPLAVPGQPAQQSTDGQASPPSQLALSQPPQVGPDGQPVQPQQGLGGQSAQQPQQALGGQPVPQPHQALGGQPVQQPQQAPGGQPVPQPQQGLGGQPVQQPQRALGGQPIPQPQQAPGGQPIPQPQQGLGGQPVPQPQQALGGQPVPQPLQALGGQPVPQPLQALGGQPVQQPQQAPGGQPVRQPQQALGGQPSPQPQQAPGGQPIPQTQQGLGGQPSPQPQQALGGQPSPQPQQAPGGQPIPQTQQAPGGQPIPQPQQAPGGQPSPQPQQAPGGQPSPQPQQGLGGQPVPQPQQGLGGQPSPQPQQGLGGQPVPQPQQALSGQPVQQPQQAPGGQPVPQPQQALGGQPVQQPQQAPGAQPVPQPQQAPGGQPVPQPQQALSGQPVQQPQQAPGGQPVPQPQQGPGGQLFPPSSQQGLGGQPQQSPSAQPSQQGPGGQPFAVPVRPAVQPYPPAALQQEGGAQTAPSPPTGPSPFIQPSHQHPPAALSQPAAESGQWEFPTAASSKPGDSAGNHPAPPAVHQSAPTSPQAPVPPSGLPTVLGTGATERLRPGRSQQPQPQPPTPPPPQQLPPTWTQGDLPSGAWPTVTAAPSASQRALSDLEKDLLPSGHWPKPGDHPPTADPMAEQSNSGNYPSQETQEQVAAAYRERYSQSAFANLRKKPPDAPRPNPFIKSSRDHKDAKDQGDFDDED